MSLIVAVLLGIVQGIAEFLPVSSSGHLMLLGKVFGIQNDIFSISILLHFATLFAVIFAFRKEIWEMLKRPLSKNSINIYLATIPTFIVVLLYKLYLEDLFGVYKLLPFGFLITALLLFLTYLLSNNKRKTQYSEDLIPIKKSSAILMGVAQGFAVLPGISRLGATMCTGILAGEDEGVSVKFSFLLSIPIILASMANELIKGGFSNVSNIQKVLPLILSFSLAFAVGLLSIQFMLNIVKKGRYFLFSIYLFVISIISFFVI